MACRSIRSIFAKTCSAVSVVRCAGILSRLSSDKYSVHVKGSTVTCPPLPAKKDAVRGLCAVNAVCLRLHGFATLAASEKNVSKKDLVYPNILIKLEGHDEAVLDNYCQFVRSASHVLGLDVTKQFNLPTEKFSQILANLPDSYKKHKVRYQFKKYGRMIQVKELPVEQADILLQYLQINLPEGINVHMELKTWQDYVSPPDPRIEEERKLDILRKKGKLNMKS